MSVDPQVHGQVVQLTEAKLRELAAKKNVTVMHYPRQEQPLTPEQNRAYLSPPEFPLSQQQEVLDRLFGLMDAELARTGPEGYNPIPFRRQIIEDDEGIATFAKLKNRTFGRLTTYQADYLDFRSFVLACLDLNQREYRGEITEEQNEAEMRRLLQQLTSPKTPT